MRIPTWRFALTGGAIVILATVGVGLVAASTAAPTTPAAQAAAVPSTAPAGTSDVGGALGERLGHRFGRAMADRLLARHLVHATITVTGKDGNLVTFQLDHGTIASIGSGSLAISEAGGGTVTVSTDANTVVFLGGGAGKGSLAALKLGDQVFVQSRVDGGNVLAKNVLRVPATTGG